MDINTITLKAFREMEPFGQDEKFDSVIIVPTDSIHDSKFRCMKFILVRLNEIVGCVGGWSDVVHPNGIGNCGREYKVGGDNKVPYLGLSLDCLAESRCVRIMMGRYCKCDDFIGSDFNFYIDK